MKNLLNENGKLYRLLEMIMELGIMNFLFLLCSLPVITVGPAYVALLGCADAFWKEEGSTTSGTFFRYFRRAFLPSMLLGLASLLVLGLLAYNILFTLEVFAGITRILLLGIYFLLILFVLAFVCHLARIIGHFGNFRRGYLKGAFLAVVTHVSRSLGIAVVTASPVVLLFFPVGVILAMMPVVLFFWFSTVAVCSVKLSAGYEEEMASFCENC